MFQHSESLERRTLLAAIPINPQGRFITQFQFPFPTPRIELNDRRELTLVGTPGNDKIRVRVVQTGGANRILFTVNRDQRSVLLRNVAKLTIVGDYGFDGDIVGNDEILCDDPLGLLANRRVFIYGDNPDDPQFTGDDTLVGTPARDRIFGGPGNDSILGADGNDIITGDSGNDSIFGGPGNDSILGGDVEAGQIGNNYILGEDGSDTITGGSFEDTILGGLGNDSLNGLFGNDTIQGNEGNDTIFGGTDDDLIYGLDGDDNIFGDNFLAPSAMTTPDGHGNDTIFGGRGNDSIWGEGGNDDLRGEDGSDTLLGHFGVDRLDGGRGNDYLNGHEERDAVRGGPGRDRFNLIDRDQGQTDFKLGEDNPDFLPAQATFGSEQGPIEI